MSDFVILAIDQGTTGSRAIVFDRDGRTAGSAYSEFRQIYPRPGWVEHDPEEIWSVTEAVMAAALADAGCPPAAVAAVGIANQRETTVLWDRASGRPVANAIVWQCRRTAPMCAELKRQGREQLFRERTGLLLDPYFSGTKLAWLLDELPGVRRRAEAGDLAFGTIDSWLVWKLTGGRVHATDPTNASRSLMFDIHRRIWDAELLGILGVPAAVLPEVRPSCGQFGAAVGGGPLAAGVPIGGIAGDQQAALFGQGCLEPGTVKNTYGTGCFLVMNTGKRAARSSNGLLTTLAIGPDGGPCYALEGSVFVAGAALQWLRDGLGLIDSAPAADRIAESLPDTGGVYLVPAFVGLGAPYWDADARGAFLGLTRGTRREHLVRAALEAIAYQSRDIIEAMIADTGMAIPELRVDGGAVRSDFLMQFQADLAGIPVDRPVLIETTAAGAAYLAGLAVGWYTDAHEPTRLRRRERLFEPAMAPDRREGLYGGWRAAVRRTRSF